jgi:hypothetical protein
VKAPDAGWGAARTTGELAGAGALLAAFAVNEVRHKNPLFPLSILRIPGLAAADATQMIAIAGFYSMFFFITLYMQNVLGYSPIKAGSAWLPTTFGVAVGAGVCTQLLTRTSRDRRRSPRASATRCSPPASSCSSRPSSPCARPTHAGRRRREASRRSPSRPRPERYSAVGS